MPTFFTPQDYTRVQALYVRGILAGMLEITEAATEVLERAYDAAAAYNPDAKIRVFRRGGQVETGFADAPQSDDETIEHEGMVLYVAADVGAGVLDTSEQHDRLIVKPAG